MDNHRSKLNQLTNLYLYNHFISDGHCEGDIKIMPIEKISACDWISSTSRRLDREAYWCRELCTLYPYDNVRGVGNISKMIKEGLIVSTLFNKREKSPENEFHRTRRKVDWDDLTVRLENLLLNYTSNFFVLILEVSSSAYHGDACLSCGALCRIGDVHMLCLIAFYI